MDLQDIVIAFALLLLGLSLVAMFRLGRAVTRLERTVGRMERATFTVASGRDVIADNLAQSVSRANETDGQPGEAADAALRDDTSPRH